MEKFLFNKIEFLQFSRRKIFLFLHLLHGVKMNIFEENKLKIVDTSLFHKIIIVRYWQFFISCMNISFLFLMLISYEFCIFDLDQNFVFFISS